MTKEKPHREETKNMSCVGTVESRLFLSGDGSSGTILGKGGNIRRGMTGNTFPLWPSSAKVRVIVKAKLIVSVWHVHAWLYDGCFPFLVLLFYQPLL